MAKVAEISKRYRDASNGTMAQRMLDVLSPIADDTERLARVLLVQRSRRATGALEATILANVFREGRDIAFNLRAGSRRVPYASIQEDGGTIVPKKGRGGGKHPPMLAIPIDPSVRGLAPRTGSVTARAANLPNTFIARSRKGNLIIFQKTDDGIKPLWVLKLSVTLRGKRYMRDAMEAAVFKAKRSLAPEIARFLETGR